MEFKRNYFHGDRQAQKTVLQKELCKKCKGFGAEELLKTENDANQTKLEASCLTIARQTFVLLKQ